MCGAGVVRVGVLGPLRATGADDRDVTPDGDLQRRLLALLVLRRGHVVSVDDAVEALWPRRVPADPAAALQTHVFRLRRVLPDGLVASSGAGYRVEPERVDVDAERLARAVTDAGALLAADPPAAAALLTAALATWRGAPYPELADTDAGRAEAGRLDELRVRAVELRAEAQLRAGTADDVLGELTALADEHPLRERPRELLMTALAAAGRHVEALRVYDDFRRLLADELGVEPSPALAARHVELLRGGAGLVRPRHRLPSPATSFIGRDQLVADAVGMATTSRVVTLLGPGGVGKTRLLIEVGHRLLDADPERPVVLCELAAASPDGVLDVVAAALGINQRPNVPLRDRIVALLGDSSLVLLLDNCEHVLDEMAALVDDVVVRCPDVTVLTSSRERLRVGGEQLCPVPPLPLAADGPARHLFVDRAAAVRPGFRPTPEEEATIDDIVARLDGLPLAIELAAARLHTMGVDEVAAGLDRRFRLLATGPRHVARHRSLAAAVTWSFDLLDTELRDVLIDVSVFAGAFTPADAAAVAGIDAVAARDSLDTLTERSLVTRAPNGRFVLLETLRAFGADRLELAGRTATVSERHARHEVAWIEAADRRMRAPSGGDVIAEVDAALPELRAALTWCLTHGEVELAGRLAVALGDYGQFRLRPDVLAWADEVLARDPADATSLAAELWATSAMRAWIVGDLGETAARLDRALAVTARNGARHAPLVLDMLGAVAMFEGQLATALTWLRRARVVTEDDAGWSLMVGGLEALTLSYAGDPSAATAAARVLERAGDAITPHSAFAWYAAGEAVMADDVALARARLARALEIADATGATFITGLAGTTDVSIEARDGDPLLAAAEYRRLIGHWRRAGMWSTQWTMLRAIASLLGRLGRDREAAVLVGAVTNTTSGHRLFGYDEIAIAELGSRLRAAMGDVAYDAAVAAGAVLDGDAAVEHALRSL
ncbi:MAG TPA: BTAD domain-containing putative transcriptional regulator [Ilumatobacteraceae bacterium]|nr:BTAD domain-containing putative transcriptional regulator [Ilumatobacteraceae bacterium]